MMEKLLKKQNEDISTISLKLQQVIIIGSRDAKKMEATVYTVSECLFK